MPEDERAADAVGQEDDAEKKPSETGAAEDTEDTEESAEATGEDSGS